MRPDRGGTAHNIGPVPMLVLTCPPEEIDPLPSLWEMFAAIETWVARTTRAALDAQGATLPVPTWDELCRGGRHPRRARNEF